MTVVHSQRDVLAWARATVDALNISREEVDKQCGFGDRYSNNLLSPSPSKRLAVGSLFSLIRGLGHELHIVPNDKAMAALRMQITPRKMKVWVRSVPNGLGKHGIVSKRFMRKIGALGGKARAIRMNPLWRRGVARRAAISRWNKTKERATVKP